MERDFPGAVPEIPVSDVDTAAAYYKKQLGFRIDWGGEGGGIPSQSRASCMSSRSQTWMATCFAFSTIFRGRPPEYDYVRTACSHVGEAE